MRKTLVPVLLLATVALSTSNLIPILSMNEFKTEPLGSNGRQHDNIFSSKYQTRSKLNDILLNIDKAYQESSDTSKYFQEYLDNDANKNIDDNYDSIWRNDNYNVKGYRKEQWHNYPRQLDRLNKQFYENRNTDKRNLDPDDPGNSYSDDSVEEVKENNNDIDLIQLQDTSSGKTNEQMETAAAMINPLIVLRIHLDCLKKNANHNQYPVLETPEIKIVNPDIYKGDNVSDEPNSSFNVIKVKREGKDENDGSTQPLPKSKTVNKRIFSLWSRLQSLNQRGHELHHRRHLYALYGLPESDSSGVLTAETRATFLRPPGSPLRWG